MMKKVVNRCTGHCCEDFTIKGQIEGYESDHWEHAYVKQWQDYGTGFLDSSEQQTILDMLIPVPREEGDTLDSFTCRNFNRVTRNCMIYASRPKMCRDYPNGKACEWEECTREEITYNGKDG